MAGEMRRPNREEEQSELRRGNAGRRLPPKLTSSGIGCKRLARMVVGGSKKKKKSEEINNVRRKVVKRAFELMEGTAMSPPVGAHT